MGQSTSMDPKAESFAELDFLHEQIRKHSLTLRQLTFLTYDDLHDRINELNALSSKFVDCNGKQLLFEVKPGSDSSVLWKGTVRIKCVKLNPETQKVEKTRELNLKQFLQVYNTMQLHLTASKTSEQKGKEHGDDGTECCASSTKLTNVDFELGKHGMDTSVLLDKFPDSASVGSSSTLEECCICMESKPEVSLPCAHSYCLACIEQWNVDHKSCPICRETLNTTDDTWVLEDPPSTQDVSQEIQKSLFDLTR